MSQSTSSKTPIVVALLLVLGGLVIAQVSGGLTSGSIIGGIVAGGGAIPSLYGAWKGMQQETQAGLAASLGMGLLCLGAGGILILLAVVDWIR